MGSFYAEQVRKALIGRAGDWLNRASWPRATLMLIFLMSTAAAYAVSTRLTNAQVGGLAVRFVVSFAAGYASFFLLSGAWFMLRSPICTETLMRGAPNEPETHEPWFDPDDHEPVKERLQSELENQAEDGLGAVLMFIAAVAIFGFAFVAVFRVMHAAWYLGELLVLGGKVEHTTRNAPKATPWPIVVARQSYIEALFLAVHYFSLGLILQLAFPKAESVMEIFRG